MGNGVDYSRVIGAGLLGGTAGAAGGYLVGSSEGHNSAKNKAAKFKSMANGRRISKDDYNRFMREHGNSAIKNHKLKYEQAGTAIGALLGAGLGARKSYKEQKLEIEKQKKVNIKNG